MCGGLILSVPFQRFLGGTVPEHFAESRTVFIPKASDIDDNGRIIRSPDALRPLTLCNCDCKLLTTAICRGLQWYTMRCIHPSQRCISSRQMTDNIFEIENHRSGPCCVRSARIRYPVDRRRCCLSQRQSLLDRLRARENRVAWFYLPAASCAVPTTTAPRTWNSREQLVGNSLWPRV